MTITQELVQDTWELQEQNFRVFIPYKMIKSMYCYQSVCETQSAELFPRLVKKYEINKCGSIKN